MKKFLKNIICGDNCIFFIGTRKGEANLNLQPSNTEKKVTTVLQNLH